MVRKQRKPLNSVDGNANRVLPARGKSLRRTNTNNNNHANSMGMDHQYDDDAYDFLSTSSSISSRPFKRTKHDGSNAMPMIDSDTKTPRISNLSVAEHKARVAAWVLPPRTPKLNHATTTVVMAVNTTAARSTAPTQLVHPPQQRPAGRNSKNYQSLLQQHAERARKRPPPPQRPPPPPPPLASKAPRLARNAEHAAAPRTGMARGATAGTSRRDPPLDTALDEPQRQPPSLDSRTFLRDKDNDDDDDMDLDSDNESLGLPLDTALVQRQQEPSLDSRPFLRDKDDHDDDANDDMDLDSDNESLGLASPNSISGGATCTVPDDNDNNNSTTTDIDFDTAITTGMLPIAGPTKDKEWVLQAPDTGTEDEAAVTAEILRPVSVQKLAVPVAKQQVVKPVFPAKTPRWLRQSTTTPGKQRGSPSGADDGTPAAAVVARTLSNSPSPKPKSPLLLEAMEIARQRLSAKKERVYSPSVLELSIHQAPTAVNQVLSVPKSAVQKRIEKVLKVLKTPKTHSPSMLENMEDPSSQLVRPVSRNVMEKYRRSSADNKKVVQAMLQSGTPRTPADRTLDSPMRDTLALIGTTVKLQRCDSLDGSEMTMEDLQRKIRPKVRAKVLEREQQTARPETLLDKEANPITEETVQVLQVQSPDLLVDDEEQLEATEVDLLVDDEEQLEATEVESLNPQSRHDCSPEPWTAEAAGHTNSAPIFELRGGVLYRHPPMPPGWSLGVSRSKNKPYYYHPDFGTSFFCPVPLPSANGLLVKATRVTQPREQSVGTFSISRFGTGRSPATDSFETAVTSTSHGDSQGTTPALRSRSTTFYSPDTVGASARTLFAIPIESERLGTDADNASGSTVESVLVTQASPRGVEAFSSGPNSQASPRSEIQETVVAGKHARYRGGRETLATDEASSSTIGESALNTKASTPDPFSQASSMMEIEETVVAVTHARRPEDVVLAHTSLRHIAEGQRKNGRVILDDSSAESKAGNYESSLAAEIERENLRTEERLGIGFSSTPSDELIGVVVLTPVETDTFSDNYNDAPVSCDNKESPPFPSGDGSSAMSNASVNNERPASPSAEGASPMSGKSDRSSGEESQSFPTNDDPSPKSRKSDLSNGEESQPFPTNDVPSPMSRKSDRSNADESQPFPTNDDPSSMSQKSDRSNGEESQPFPTNDDSRPISQKSDRSNGEESQPFPTNDDPSTEQIQVGFTNNLTPHLDAQLRYPSSSFAPVFSPADSGHTAQDLAKLSRVMSHSKDVEDEVSALDNDNASYMGTGDYSYASRAAHSRQSKDSRGGSSLASLMSHRVLHPPMPLCSLQNLDSLPTAKKKPRRKQKSKKHSMRPRDVLDSLGAVLCM
jgi:hypothetical protein